jgi:hypothetical protein
MQQQTYFTWKIEQYYNLWELKVNYRSLSKKHDNIVHILVGYFAMVTINRQHLIFFRKSNSYCPAVNQESMNNVIIFWFLSILSSL